MAKPRLGNLALTEAPSDAAARVAAGRAPVVGEALRAVPVGTLARSPWQPRQALDEDRLAELTESVRARGVLEPLLAREREGGRLELLAGERRLEAARRAGLATVPVRVLAGLSDAEAREVALVENLARADLTAWEEATALAQLRDARAAEGKPTDVRTLAAVSGRSKSVVGRRVFIADRLTAEVRAAVPSWDTVANNAAALEAAAASDAPDERARLLVLAAASPAPGVVAHAERHRASGPPDSDGRAAGDGEAPATYTLRGAPDARLSLTIRGPVAALAPADARALREALAPLLAALDARGAPRRGRARP